MAKIQDKLYNRIIEGEIKGLSEEDIKLLKENMSSVSYLIVSNITGLTDEQINSLNCGDIVLKKDSSGLHAYIVSYKKSEVGICLTYTDASMVETQSYDYTGGHWVYNSEDKMPLVNVEGASSGTIQDVLGLNSSGKLVKGSISGGTKLYLHKLDLGDNSWVFLISNNNGKLTQLVNLTMSNITGLGHLVSAYYVSGSESADSHPITFIGVKSPYTSRTIGYINSSGEYAEKSVALNLTVTDTVTSL